MPCHALRRCSAPLNDGWLCTERASANRVRQDIEEDIGVGSLLSFAFLRCIGSLVWVEACLAPGSRDKWLHAPEGSDTKHSVGHISHCHGATAK